MPAALSRRLHDYVQLYNTDVCSALGVADQPTERDMMGVEIELEFHDRLRELDTIKYGSGLYDRYGDRVSPEAFVCQDIARVIGTQSIRAMVKHDGSLNDGVEVCTEPTPFSSARDIARLYTALQDIGGAISTRCGFHVHINREAFGSNTALDRWLQLWSADAQLIRIIAGRRMKPLQLYASPRTTRMYHSNYDGWVNRVIAHHRENGLQAPRPTSVSTLRASDHYGSVGLRHAHTAELRVFAAPRSYAVCMQRLDLILKSVAYVRDEITFADADSYVSWENFYKWLCTTQRKSDAHVYLRKRHKVLQTLPVWGTNLTFNTRRGYFPARIARTTDILETPEQDNGPFQEDAATASELEGLSRAEVITPMLLHEMQNAYWHSAYATMVQEITSVATSSYNDDDDEPSPPDEP